MRWSRKERPGASPGASPSASPSASPGAQLEDQLEDQSEEVDPRRNGPWDASELPISEDDDSRADLGSLSIRGRPEIEIRLQVDEESGEVGSVLMVVEDGAMELRAFAAPRNEDMWDEVRVEIAAEAERRGGAARDVPGPYGTALQMVIPVETPEGEQGAQQTVVLGISGPRWLLRATMFGRPALGYDPDGLLEGALREVVVTRGGEPMTPGEPLPVALPTGARRIQAP